MNRATADSGLLQGISLVVQGLQCESIGGHLPDSFPEVMAENSAALQDFIVGLHALNSGTALTDEQRQQILSEFMLTEVDASRVTAARETIRNYMDLAATMSEPAEKFAMEMLARLEKPNLIPSVLHAEQTRVLNAITRVFVAEVQEYVAGRVAAGEDLLQSSVEKIRAAGVAFSLPCTDIELSHWQQVLQAGIVSTLEHQFRIALEEAVTNSLMHGNQGNPEKLVSAYYGANANSSGNGFLVVLTDEGEGFDPEALRDPTENQNLELASGRGVYLMHEFVSKITYSNGGRTVSLAVEFETAVPSAAESVMENIHKHFRRESNSSLEKLVASENSSLSSILRTIVDFHLAQSGEMLFSRACESLGEGYSVSTQGEVDFSSLKQQLRQNVLANVRSQLKRDALQGVEVVLANEYRVDIDAPVRFQLGVAFTADSPQFVIQLDEPAKAVALSGNDIFGIVEYPARRLSPSDLRHRLWSPRGALAFIWSGVLGNLPADSHSFNLNQLVTEHVTSAAISIARRSLKQTATDPG